MRPEDDDTSLGAILLKMGAISSEQLQDALDYQENASIDHMLGQVMLAFKFCSPEQLVLAVHAQDGMRADTAAEQAYAVADLADHRRKLAREARQTMIERSKLLYKKATGRDYPAITKSMLAVKPEG
jgi:hypothetical protein